VSVEAVAGTPTLGTREVRACLLDDPDDMITAVVSEPVNILSLKINAVHAREAHMADGRLRTQRALRQACGGGSARLRRTARPAKCSKDLRGNAWPSGEAQVAEHGLAVPR